MLVAAMEPSSGLRDLVAVLAVSLLVVAALHRLRVPVITGFIVAGALVGPRGLALIPETREVEALAETGVILLLFGIGLELSLDRLRRLWRPILLGGALQVALTILAAGTVAAMFGLPSSQAVFLGCLVALSSTAVVLRGLQERGELDTPHGRLTLGILVFQDLCVVPMMLAVPALAGAGGGAPAALGTLARAVLLLAAVLLAARVVVPRGLALVARTRRRDLFVLAVILVCAATAWIASLAGVSLALGAFLAGLVVAGSEYRQQALSDLIPFREVFTSVFFVSVGMLIEPRLLLERAPAILGILGAILLGKFLIVFLAGSLMRLPLRVTVQAATALAQVGEFAFVLMRAPGGTGLLPPVLETDLLLAVILSLFVTPLLLAAGPHIAAGMSRATVLTRLLGVRSAVEASEEGRSQRDHVIIAGYGITGQELSRSLREEGIPYLVVDLNPENVRRALADGEPAVFGDVTSPEVQEHIGAARARRLVLVINDADAARRAVDAVARTAPGLPVLVRTHYVIDVPFLLAAGADAVVPAELEAAAEVTSQVLRERGVDAARIESHVARIRSRRED